MARRRGQDLPEPRHQPHRERGSDRADQRAAEIRHQFGPKEATDLHGQRQGKAEEGGERNAGAAAPGAQPDQHADHGVDQHMDEEAADRERLGDDVVVPERHQAARVELGKRGIERQPVARDQALREGDDQQIRQGSERRHHAQPAMRAQEAAAVQPIHDADAKRYADRAIDDRQQHRRRVHDEQRRDQDGDHHREPDGD